MSGLVEEQGKEAANLDLHSLTSLTAQGAFQAL